MAFSELERFIDMQVRHYSSGMYVRLGFAVAVNVDPDILLVDEVLAVGDEAFQRKCLDRVAKFQREGRTILLVTHAADLVRRVCDRAIVLDHGEMVADATPGEAVRTFRETLLHGDGLAAPWRRNPKPRSPLPTTPVSVPRRRAAAEPTTHGKRMASSATGRVRITNVAIEHPGRLVGRTWLLPDEAMTIRVSYHATEPTDDLLFGIAIYDQDGNHLFGTNTRVLDIPVPPASGDGEMSFEFGQVPLLDGTFLVTLAIQTSDEGTVYDWRDEEYSFAVMNPGREAGLVSFPVAVHFAGDHPAREEADAVVLVRTKPEHRSERLSVFAVGGDHSAGVREL